MNTATPITDAELAALDAAVERDEGGCECCGSPVKLTEKDGKVTGYHYDHALRNSYAALRARLDAAEAEVEEQRTKAAFFDADHRLTLMQWSQARDIWHKERLELRQRIAALEGELRAARAERDATGHDWCNKCQCTKCRCRLCGATWCLDCQKNPLVCPNCGGRPRDEAAAAIRSRGTTTGGQP